MKINKLLFIIGLYSNTFGAPQTVQNCKALWCQYTKIGVDLYFLSKQINALRLYNNIKFEEDKQQLIPRNPKIMQIVYFDNENPNEYSLIKSKATSEEFDTASNNSGYCWISFSMKYKQEMTISIFDDYKFTIKRNPAASVLLIKNNNHILDLSKQDKKDDMVILQVGDLLSKPTASYESNASSSALEFKELKEIVEIMINRIIKANPLPDNNSQIFPTILNCSTKDLSLQSSSASPRDFMTTEIATKFFKFLTPSNRLLKTEGHSLYEFLNFYILTIDSTSFTSITLNAQLEEIGKQLLLQIADNTKQLIVVCSSFLPNTCRTLYEAAKKPDFAAVHDINSPTLDFSALYNALMSLQNIITVIDSAANATKKYTIYDANYNKSICVFEFSDGGNSSLLTFNGKVDVVDPETQITSQVVSTNKSDPKVLAYIKIKDGKTTYLVDGKKERLDTDTYIKKQTPSKQSSALSSPVSRESTTLNRLTRERNLTPSSSSSSNERTIDSQSPNASSPH